MPSIPEQAGGVGEVDNHRRVLVLAYVEGADDERSALSAGDAIVQRYVAMVEAEGWEPPSRRERTGSNDAG